MRRVLGALVLLVGGTVRAQQAGMYCVGVRDDGPRGSVARSIVMDGDTLDCLVKLPAKAICRTAVAVRPGDAPPAVAADASLCYAVRCPREQTHRRLVDEFGAHDVRGDRGKLYCTPGALME